MIRRFVIKIDHNSMPHKRQRRAALAHLAPREYTECMPNASAPHADHRLKRPGAPKLLFAFLAVCYSLSCSQTQGQFGIELIGELTETIRVNEPEPDVRTQLERVRLSLAEQQWDEAVESLRKIMENHGERMVRLDDRRFMPLREYCHILLRGLPPEGLAIYRGRVDAQANEWLDEGLRRRNRSQLQRVVDELFASSHTDEALLALGEIALERGEFARPVDIGNASARSSVLTRQCRCGCNSKNKKQQNKSGIAVQPAALHSRPPGWPTRTPTGIWQTCARLVLVSIMEGAFERAETELEALLADHPDAQGRLAGREAPYQETLAALLSAAKAWPSSPKSTAPTTFGGTPDRNYVADGPFRLRRLLWSIPFLESWQANTELRRIPDLPKRRVAESRRAC